MSTPLPPSDDDRPTEGESAEAIPATPDKPRRTPRASTGTGAGRTTTSRSTTRTPATTPGTGASSAEQDDVTPAAAPAAVPAGDAKPATARKTTTARSASKSATGGASKAVTGVASKPATSAATKKPATSRTRRTTAKPTPIAPEGEAPDIMDATLGAREPLAGTSPAARTRTDTSSSPAEPLTETDVAATKRLPTAEEVYAGTPAASGDTTEAAAPAAVPAAGPAESTAVLADPVVPAEPGEPVEPVAATGPDVSAFEGVPDSESASATETTTPVTSPTERLEPVSSTAATPAAVPGTQPGAHGRTVNDLADRLDDSRFFSSLFDFTFTNYVTRKLAGPVYVVGLVLIGLGIVVGFANSLSSAIATHAPIGAFVFLFGVLITLVGAMLAVLLLRVGIEVFCAIIEIAQNTRRRRPPSE